MFTNFIGTSVLWISVCYFILWEVVVLHVIVWQGFWIHLVVVGDLLECCFPWSFSILVVFTAYPIAMVLNVFLKFRHQVFAGLLVSNFFPPAEVVQAVVVEVNVMPAVKTADSCHSVHVINRHVTDVDNFCVWTKTTASFSNDRNGVGVVDHPSIWWVFLHPVNDLNDGRNWTKTVSHSSGSGSFLTIYAVFQWDLFIQASHVVFTNTNWTHYEVNVSKGFLRISGVWELNLWSSFLHDDLNSFTNLLLTFCIVIVELQLSHWELVLTLD